MSERIKPNSHILQEQIDKTTCAIDKVHSLTNAVHDLNFSNHPRLDFTSLTGDDYIHKVDQVSAASERAQEVALPILTNRKAMLEQELDSHYSTTEAINRIKNRVKSGIIPSAVLSVVDEIPPLLEVEMKTDKTYEITDKLPPEVSITTPSNLSENTESSITSQVIDLKLDDLDLECFGPLEKKLVQLISSTSMNNKDLVSEIWGPDVPSAAGKNRLGVLLSYTRKKLQQQGYNIPRITERNSNYQISRFIPENIVPEQEKPNTTHVDPRIPTHTVSDVQNIDDSSHSASKKNSKIIPTSVSESNNQHLPRILDLTSVFKEDSRPMKTKDLIDDTSPLRSEVNQVIKDSIVPVLLSHVVAGSIPTTVHINSKLSRDLVGIVRNLLPREERSKSLLSEKSQRTASNDTVKRELADAISSHIQSVWHNDTTDNGREKISKIHCERLKASEITFDQVMTILGAHFLDSNSDIINS